MINLPLFSLKTGLVSIGAIATSVTPLIYSVHGASLGGGANETIIRSRNSSTQVAIPFRKNTPKLTNAIEQAGNLLNEQKNSKPYSTPQTFIRQNFNLGEQNKLFREREIGLTNQTEAKIQVQKITKVEDSIQLDISNPYHQNYRKFVSNLLSIMKGIIWTNSPYQDLWIDQVYVHMPQNKFKERSPLLKHRTTKKVFTSADFSETIEDSDTVVDIFNISANPSQTLSMRQQRGGQPPEQLSKALQIMSNLVRTFLTEDWAPKSNPLGEREFILSPISVRTNKSGDSGGFWIRNILRFVRVFEGKYYYCDIYFTSGMEQNMIRSHYVYYKDKNWKEGAYYQANGDWGFYGKNIGGNGSFLWWNQRSWNGIDTEFATLFESKPERAQQIWKWFEIVSRCLEVEECRKTLHSSSSYTILDQREEPISRDDSYKQSIYRRIHPFSKIYYDVSEQLNSQALAFSF